VCGSTVSQTVSLSLQITNTQVSKQFQISEQNTLPTIDYVCNRWQAGKKIM